MILYGIINKNAEIKVKIIHKFIPTHIDKYNLWIVGTDDYDILVDGSNLNTIPGTKHYVIYGSFDEYGVTKYYDKSRSDIILYGLINYKGVDLTGPKYSRIRSPLKNGVRISIKPDSGSSVMEHMGILDHNGKEIIEFKYTKILPVEYNDNLYKLGYTNESGVHVTEYCDYKGNIYSDVDDALASLKKEEYIKEENGGVSTTFGFINSDGDIILPIIYNNIRKPDDSNIYMISNRNSYAIFDFNLNQLTPFIYANGYPVFDKFGTAKLKKGKISDSMYTLQHKVLIDKDGNELTNTENIYTYIYNSNSFGVRRALKQANDGYFYWGLLGNDGNEIIEFKYDSIKPMHIDGTYEMKITENDKNIYEYCNYRGKIFDTPEDAIKSMDEQINENNIPVLKRFGIIESSCKFIIPIEYNDIVHVKRIDRYIITNEHFQDALFDENLNKLTDFFYSIRRFDPIHNTAIFLKDKLGTMDADGNIITPPIYVSISEPDIYGTRIARYESIQSFGLLDKNGHEITEFIYRNIDKIAPEVIDYNGVYKLYELYEEDTYKITYASHRGNIYNAVVDAIEDNKIVEDDQINENNTTVLKRFGIIESSCKFIIPIEYNEIVHEKRIDRYIITNEDFQQALFDENLNRLTDFFYFIERFDPIHNTAKFIKNRIGIIDADGNVVISPKYSAILEPDVYGTRKAAYNSLNHLGLLDKNGNEITEFIYDHIEKIDTELVQHSGVYGLGVYKLYELCKDGMHKITYASHHGKIYNSFEDVIKDNKIVEDEQINENNTPVLKMFGIIESSCKFIIPIKCYKIVHEKRIDRYIIRNEHFKQALFDENLNRLTKFFYSIRRFDPIHNTAIFEKDKFGTMDADGNVLISPKYFSISEPDVYGTRIAKYEPSNSHGLVDKNGNEITKFIYDFIDKIDTEVVQYSGGVYKLFELREYGQHKLTYVSHRGNIYNSIVDAIEDDKIVESISNGVIVESTLEKNEVRYDIINKDCHLYGDFEFDSIYTDNIGNLIYSSGDLWGILNPNLDRLFDIRAYSISNFWGNKVGLYKCNIINGKTLIYDSIKDIVSQEYDNIRTFLQTKLKIINENIFIVSRNNKWAICDSNFNEITKMVYDDISGMLLDDSGVTIAKKGKYKGLLDIYTGKQLTKIIYDNISFNSTDKIITLKIKESSNPKTHYYHINNGELIDT